MSIFSCNLSNEALIHLRGKKIPEFLQGQLTCDTRKLASHRSVSGAFCSVKGRVISDLLAIRISEDHCLLRLRKSVGKPFADDLRRYAQFSRISVEIDEDQSTLYGFYTLPSTPEDDLHGLELPLEPSEVLHRPDGLLLRRAGKAFEIIDLKTRDSDAGGRSVREDLQKYALGTEQGWRIELMRSGHYCIEGDDLGAFTPQTLNYDRSGLVAFDKGCYTGQEVIARLHYKGKAKRRVQIYDCKASDLAALDNAVRRDDPIHGSDGREIGRVLRVEADAGQESALLAAEVVAEQLDKTAQLAGEIRLRPLAAPWRPAAEGRETP